MQKTHEIKFCVPISVVDRCSQISVLPHRWLSHGLGFKNVGRSFCERELGQFCASPLFSDEKQSESFFWKRTEREREREREKRRKEKKSNFYSIFFFDEIFYSFFFFFWLRGTYIDNAIHTRGETITNNSYNSNITNPNQVRIN